MSSRRDTKVPRFLPVLLWAAGLVLAGAGLFTLYVRQSRLAPFNSDGASNVLQAQSMLQGNLLLHGWWTSDVSFYTTELPEYMLVEAFRGVAPDVVHICGALTYALMVLLAALVARGRSTGQAGIIRALVAGGIMLAPAIVGGTEIFLENPDHAGTAVPILVVLLLLDRAPERWYVPVAICVLLAWIAVADDLTLIAATAPLAAVAAVRLLLLCARRRPLAEYRYDALLLAAAALSVGIARVAERELRSAGGFTQKPLQFKLLAPAAQIPTNIKLTGRALRVLFGAAHPANSANLETIAWYHLVGLALAAAGFAVAAIVFLTRHADRCTQVVFAGTVATLAAAIFSTVLTSLANTHEIAILLPFGAVLAGRLRPPRLDLARWRPGPWTWSALAAWLGAGLAALCFAASWAPMGSPAQPLSNWLVSHHYTDGLAGYWQADVTTVTSGGKAAVSPLTRGATAIDRWESAAGWYDPAHQRANFVVAVTNPAQQDGLSVAAVRRYFGRPAHQYYVRHDVVMVYDYNLLTRLDRAR